MKNISYYSIAMILFLAVFLESPRGETAESPGEPVITASSAILIEAVTGRVVYEKNADASLPPASMTKMMTCILGLEVMAPRSVITVTPNAAMTEDSFLGLMPGEQMDAQNILRGMMMVSDNGAAVAIAEHIDGSVQKFAQRMNEKAADIGCRTTHFANPNGLPNNAHLSTARDMAKIAAYGMKNRQFRELVGEKTSAVYWMSPRGKVLGLENTNELLGVYNGMTGIKTGWTIAAGGCLAASAKRGGVELIAIIMHAEDTKTRFTDAMKLLDYGFSRVKIKRGIIKERAGRYLWVKNGKEHRLEVGPVEDVNYPLFQGDKESDYFVEYDLPAIVEAPVKKGQKVGRLVVKYKNEEIGSIDIIAHQDIREGFSFLSYFFVELLSHFMRG